MTDEEFMEANRLHWQATFRFAVSWTNDWPDAEDIAQEAFVRLWRARRRITVDRGVLPWLLVATRRLATDRFRAMRSRSARQANRVPAVDFDLVDEWADVQQRMARLPGNDRAALMLVAVLGLDSNEAAMALGKTPSAVRAAVSRARERLGRDERR